MTRPLLIIAALGFLSCIVCFGIASSMGRLNWEHGDFWDWDGRGPAVSGDGPEVTRTLAWTGDDELTVNVSADIDYIQGPDSKLVVTGPKGAVDNLILSGDHLRYEHRLRNGPRLKIVMTAPRVTEFTLNGSQQLDITGFNQSKLEVSVNGSGKVKAAGSAERVELRIAGSGDADFGQLKTNDAEVVIAGSGDAIIAPTNDADISIAGSGDVSLATRPARVNTKIAGSGKIIQQEPAPVTPAAPPAPAPEPAPKQKL